MATRAECLRADLERYRADGERDERFRQRMLALLADPRCFSRDAFVPGHFTASTFVLSPAGDGLLLILHAKLALWLQPGVHVEPDDVDLLAAARRELAEDRAAGERLELAPAVSRWNREPEESLLAEQRPHCFGQCAGLRELPLVDR